MKHYFCNPLNLNYKYQFNKDPRKGGIAICREAADPSLIEYKGKYYIFASMSLGVYVSTDLAHWELKPLPKDLPLYDYAPDARVYKDEVYLCFSSREHKCDRYKTKDIENGPYTKLKGSSAFWDPNMFVDDDGRVYFYHGCTNTDPIYGEELDTETMNPKTEKKGLIWGKPLENGYERFGENNSLYPASEEEKLEKAKSFSKKMHVPMFILPKPIKKMIIGMFANMPYIEGAWMDKWNGKYYLQYACPGTEFNTYGDGVYTSSSPLGEFSLAKNNPYSSKASGFITGAGHGSTMEDKDGALWHVATMRISKNHDFERRIGLWRAGLDEEGNLFCNQAFGDYPFAIEDLKKDPWALPKWNLLSHHKKATASSEKEGMPASHLVDEDIRTLWQGKGEKEWVEIDLEKEKEVHAVQINFGDPKLDIPVPGKIGGSKSQARYIDDHPMHTRYLLEGSLDGKAYLVLSDKREAETDLSHDLYVSEEGIKLRYIRLSHMEVPYGQIPSLSGLRVFGIDQDAVLPEAAFYKAKRLGDLDMEIEIEPQEGVTGYNIVYGADEKTMYHSYLTYDNHAKITSLVKGRDYVVRVDSFNEKGITKGKIKHV